MNGRWKSGHGFMGINGSTQHIVNSDTKGEISGFEIKDNV